MFQNKEEQNIQNDSDDDFVFLESVYFSKDKPITDKTLDNKNDENNNNLNANPNLEANTNNNETYQQNEKEQKQHENLKDYFELSEIEKKENLISVQHLLLITFQLYLLQIIIMKIYRLSI